MGRGLSGLSFGVGAQRHQEWLRSKISSPSPLWQDLVLTEFPSLQLERQYELDVKGIRRAPKSLSMAMGQNWVGSEGKAFNLMYLRFRSSSEALRHLIEKTNMWSDMRGATVSAIHGVGDQAWIITGPDWVELLACCSDTVVCGSGLPGQGEILLELVRATFRQAFHTSAVLDLADPGGTPLDQLPAPNRLDTMVGQGAALGGEDLRIWMPQKWRIWLSTPILEGLLVSGTIGISLLVMFFIGFLPTWCFLSLAVWSVLWWQIMRRLLAPLGRTYCLATDNTGISLSINGITRVLRWSQIWLVQRAVDPSAPHHASLVLCVPETIRFSLSGYSRQDQRELFALIAIRSNLTADRSKPFLFVRSEISALSAKRSTVGADLRECQWDKLDTT